MNKISYATQADASTKKHWRFTKFGQMISSCLTWGLIVVMADTTVEQSYNALDIIYTSRRHRTYI